MDFKKISEEILTLIKSQTNIINPITSSYWYLNKKWQIHPLKAESERVESYTTKERIYESLTICLKHELYAKPSLFILLHFLNDLLIH